LLDDNFTFYKIDINDFKRLESVFEREDIDRVIHLAARAGVRASISDPLIYIKTNINGTVNLLELARRYNIQNFVFASSSSVYGERDDVPFKETDEIKPISQYAATKKSGELLGYTYNHLYKLPFIGLRFFTVYGPKGRPDMAPYKFMKAILNDEVITIYGDGSSLRDYTYVGDIVRGILLSSEKDLGYEIINLGSSKPIKLLDFVETFEKVTGKKAKIKHVEKQPGDVSKTYGDNLVFGKTNFSILRGEKVAFVGKNGEGKSTLVKAIMNQIDHDGELKLGHNTKIGYFAQNEASLLDESISVFETIDDVAKGSIRTKIRDILGAFMFGGDDWDKKVKILSGGERTRLAMIKLLLEPVNLLILDEPTNHLDIRTKDILKQALMDYDGTLILVSHDRDFLNGMVSKVFEFGNKAVKEHHEGIQEFLARKKMEHLRDLETK